MQTWATAASTPTGTSHSALQPGKGEMPVNSMVMPPATAEPTEK